MNKTPDDNDESNILDDGVISHSAVFKLSQLK